MFIVKLEHGVYLAEWEGDPGRTLQMTHAKEFETEVEANKALKKAQKIRPFKGAVVIKTY
jgi:hypothetical protein